MTVLTVGQLSKYYGAEFIFGDINFQIMRGEKVALVGANGAGKSTLLKIIAGVEQPTKGGIYLARGRRVAYLAQEARFSGARTLWQEMEHALAHLSALQQEISELEHALADTDAPDWEQRMERYGELTQRFEHGGGYGVEHRIERTLDGLGFNESQYSQPMVQLSGGQKTRAALAATLLSDPDLLLLDEPTNHLDLAALEWLERFLKDWEGTLIVISHDRYFLDHVTGRTLDMAFGRLEDYPAGYQKYMALKAERLELQMKQYQAQQDYIAKTEDFVRRFKAGQRSKEARGREKILNRLKYGHQGLNGEWIDERVDRPEQQKKLAIRMDTQIRSGDMALKLDKLQVGYPPEATPHRNGNGRVLIKAPDLEMQRGQRVALMGPNGSGKTTLLRTLVGELPPLRGQVRLGHRVEINYYAQSHEGLQMDASVLEEIRRIRPQIKETEARTLLGRFLFSGDDVYKRVGDLSGGERSRVALAQLTLLGGNLLVLDEPTNHLDINAREALETVLNEYSGSILFVSHDRYFIDAVADTIWNVKDGTIEKFDGSYSEYAAWQESLVRRPSSVVPAPAQTPAKGEQPSSNNGQRATDNGQQTASKEDRKRQRRRSALEQEIAMLEGELKQLEVDMSTAGLAGDRQRVTSLGIQYTEIQEMLSTRYDEWAAIAV
jgi:ATP-binding cassette subfamily F protein 3